MVPNITNKFECQELEEAQLFADRRWINDALTIIRNQRNCLQIERLHLESLKGHLLGDTRDSVTDEMVEEECNARNMSAIKMMQSIPNIGTIENITRDRVTDEETRCNEQELDLLLSNSLHTLKQDRLSYDTEEDEEEEDDCVPIDMSIFMTASAFGEKMPPEPKIEHFGESWDGIVDGNEMEQDADDSDEDMLL